jgi:membrane-associated phospholipid phosphatase
LHPWIRALLNPMLEHHVRAQLPAVAAAQRAAASLERASPLLGRALRALVALSAATVTVEFYIAVLPLMIWGGGQMTLAGLKLVGLLATSGYAAYALKDLLASPRPGEEAARVLNEAASAVVDDGASSPPMMTTTPHRRSSRLAARHAEMMAREQQDAGAASVFAAARSLRVIDHSKDVEDGAPSSHVSLSLPMTLHALGLLLPAAAAGPQPPLLAALAWVVFVGWSRLYLGVHTPVDLFTGAALGHLSLAAWKGHVEEAWLRWAMMMRTTTMAAPTAVPLAASAVALFAMRMHPVPTRPTACFNYSTAFVGAGLGVTLGAWAFAPRLMRVIEVAAAPTTMGPAPALLLFSLKAAVGLAAVLGTRAAVKALLLVVLPPLMDLAPWSLRALWQPPPADAALVVEAKNKNNKARRRGVPLSSSPPPRRPDNGVAYDVDAAARLGSYTAAVFVVVAHAALWPEAVGAVVSGAGR